MTRSLRVAGAVVLLTVQGGCSLMVLHERLASGDLSSRAGRRAAAIEALRTKTTLGLPSVAGYVDHLGDDAIAVTTADGRALLRVDGETAFLPTEPGATLQLGAGIIAAGTLDDHGHLVADVLLVGPPA